MKVYWNSISSVSQINQSLQKNDRGYCEDHN